MGGNNSKGRSWRRDSSAGSTSSSSYQYEANQNYAPEPAPQQAYPAYSENQNYATPYPAYPPQQNYPHPQSYAAPAQEPKRKFDRRYTRIADNYNSLEEVTEALARAGLESSNLIVGVDFTKSNEWTGAKSFGKRSLHHIGDGLNPYEQAISIIGKTLAAFDEDNLIPCFGFGDASTHDQDVFSFYPEDDRYCNGFEEVLSRYREIAPHLRLAGPTSFAPVIEMAMTIVEQSGGQYHVLVIIADGQVTRSVDTERGQLSPQEQKTVDAIVEASKLPLSIILVGVGDGPWDTMREFDDNIPARAFDNFQFVNFTEIMSKNMAQSRKETRFALEALMEIPPQYKATIELNILGTRKGNAPQRVPLPPPVHSTSSFSSSKPSHSTSFKPSSPPYRFHDSPVATAPPIPSSSFDNLLFADLPFQEDKWLNFLMELVGYDLHGELIISNKFHKIISQDLNFLKKFGGVGLHDEDLISPKFHREIPRFTLPKGELCPICLSNSKDMAFGCGHQTCFECGQDLKLCPICRSPIQTRIKLY